MWVNVGHTVNSFQRKIEIFIDDVADGKLFFPTLKKYEEDQPNAKVSHASFLDRLEDNFETRFEDLKICSWIELCWRDW